MDQDNSTTPTPDSQPEAPASSTPETTTVLPPASDGANKQRLGKFGVVPAIIVAALVLIGGSAVAYFGYVLPNQPENIWKTALNNTAKGYDKFVAYGEEQQDTKSGSLKGTFKIESAEFVADGNIDGQFDEKSSNINLDAGAAGTRLKFNIMTNVPDGASSPDIYLKAEGLDGLANMLGVTDPSSAAMISSINNQYYFIDHTLFDQLQKQITSEADVPKVDDIKPEDVVDFMKQFGEVNREYLFTTDPSKATFTMKEEVGKETVEGRETFHFKVALSKENLKAWNQAVCDRLLNHKVMKALTGKENDEERKKNCEDVSSFEEIDENETADVWVDMKTKLIRTVRITTKEDGSVDFGLLYDGGDAYPFYVNVKDEDESDVTLKMTLNTKTNAVTVALDGSFKSGSDTGDVDVNITFTPNNDKVEFTKPEGAKSLNDLLAPFLGMIMGGGQDPFNQTKMLEEDFSGFSFE